MRQQAEIWTFKKASCPRHQKQSELFYGTLIFNKQRGLGSGNNSQQNHADKFDIIGNILPKIQEIYTVISDVILAFKMVAGHFFIEGSTRQFKSLHD